MAGQGPCWPDAGGLVLRKKVQASLIRSGDGAEAFHYFLRCLVEVARVAANECALLTHFNIKRKELRS